jgi:hypothetical protein
MRRLLVVLSLVAASLITGCAMAPYMPLSEEGAKLDQTKPLYLMSVTLKNDYKERWQPRVLNVILSKENGTAKPDQIVFRMDSKGTIAAQTDKDQTTYLVRFVTENSPHTVLGFNAMASAFPVHGFYFTPLHSSIPAAAGGVYYLGAVKAVVRERKENEFRAGPVIPLIDQAVAGASSGSFDIEIGDAYGADIELFKKTFAPLKDMEIQKAVLPKWDRTKAQLFWEKN